MEIEDTNRFVCCLFPDEKEQDTFANRDMENIGRISGLDERYLVSLINNFRFQKSLHEYLKQKVKRKEELPTTQEEMMEDLDENYSEIRIKLRDKMVEEITKRLNYSEEHIQRNESNLHQTKLLKTMRTYKY